MMDRMVEDLLIQEMYILWEPFVLKLLVVELACLVLAEVQVIRVVR